MANPKLADLVARNRSAIEALEQHKQQRCEHDRILEEEQQKQDRIYKAWNEVRSFVRTDGQKEAQFIDEWAIHFLNLGIALNDQGWQSRLENIQTDNPLECLAICIFQSAILQEKDEVVRLMNQGFKTLKGNDQIKLNELLRRRVMEHVIGITTHLIGQRYANCEDEHCPSCGVHISPLTYEGCMFCKHEITRRRRLPLDAVTFLKVELLKARALADVSHKNNKSYFATHGEKQEVPSLCPIYVNDLWAAMEKCSSLHLAKKKLRLAIPQQPIISTMADYSNAMSIAEAWILEAAEHLPGLSEDVNHQGIGSLIDFRDILEHLEAELSRCEQILSQPRYNGSDAEEERKWVQNGDMGVMTLFWAEVQKDYRSLPSRYLKNAPTVPSLGMTYDRTITEVGLHIAFFERLRQNHPEIDLQNYKNKPVSVSASTVKTKPTKQRITAPKAEPTYKEGAISSALIEWHKYKDGGIGNSAPKKLSDLAREGIASKGCLSGFFKANFRNYKAYEGMCRRNDGSLLFALKLLNGDVPPHTIIDPRTQS